MKKTIVFALIVLAVSTAAFAGTWCDKHPAACKSAMFAGAAAASQTAGGPDKSFCKMSVAELKAKDPVLAQKAVTYLLKRNQARIAALNALLAEQKKFEAEAQSPTEKIFIGKMMIFTSGKAVDFSMSNLSLIFAAGNAGLRIDLEQTDAEREEMEKLFAPCVQECECTKRPSAPPPAWPTS